MAKIIIIAAVAQNNVIGNNGGIPWHIKEDFAYFQRTTMGNACVMGDRTYESLPKKVRPLPGRENIVLTRDRMYQAPGAVLAHSWDEVLALTKLKEKVFLCGGASIYSLGLECADVLQITHIEKEFVGDTFFPEIDVNKWMISSSESIHGRNLLTGEMVRMTFATYERVL